jgi:dTDP-4-dehydrorhamnose 3,5-epimerase
VIFTKTKLDRVTIVDLDKRGDDRGFFARQFCEKEFAEAGLTTRFKQVNTSGSAKKGTLRGLHYQLPPFAETKAVRCVRGAIWDVALDVRPDSPTFGQWFGTELSAKNQRMLVVSEGYAHAFITLSDDVEVMYLVSEEYSPQAERGVRWNDPKFGIEWPLEPTVISDKDGAWPDFNAEWHWPAALQKT